MKTNSVSFKRRVGSMRRAAVLAAGVLWFGCTGASAADNTNAVPAKAAPAKSAKAPKHPLSGVELYAIHCNRCHPERYPVEMNYAEWQTVMLHMRVRANLPAEQARAIMKYLQEEAGE